jgi:hypothetical protein
LIDPNETAYYTYDCGGTFGEGEAILHFETHNWNFKSMKSVGNAVWELVFDNGSIFMSRLVKYRILEWRYSSGDSVNSEVVVATWNVIKGTGDFKGFHYVQHDTSMAGSMTIAGTGFFTGK